MGLGSLGAPSRWLRTLIITIGYTKSMTVALLLTKEIIEAHTAKHLILRKDSIPLFFPSPFLPSRPSRKRGYVLHI